MLYKNQTVDLAVTSMTFEGLGVARYTDSDLQNFVAVSGLLRGRNDFFHRTGISGKIFPEFLLDECLLYGKLMFVGNVPERTSAAFSLCGAEAGQAEWGSGFQTLYSSVCIMFFGFQNGAFRNVSGRGTLNKNNKIL